MAHVAELRFLALPLAVEPAIVIRDRAVRLVRPARAMEVAGGIAAAGTISVAILSRRLLVNGPEALDRRPRLQPSTTSSAWSAAVRPQRAIQARGNRSVFSMVWVTEVGALSKLRCSRS